MPSNLHLSYDDQPFETAVTHSDGQESGSVLELLEQYIADGLHDWMNGHCETFTIWDQTGSVFFKFQPSIREAA